MITRIFTLIIGTAEVRSVSPNDKGKYQGGEGAPPLQRGVNPYQAHLLPSASSHPDNAPGS